MEQSALKNSDVLIMCCLTQTPTANPDTMIGEFCVNTGKWEICINSGKWEIYVNTSKWEFSVNTVKWDLCVNTDEWEFLLI